MVFTTLTQAKAAFKRGFGKTHTGNQKELANEAIASEFSVAVQNVFGESISSDPATAVAAGVALDATGAAELDLVADPSSDGKAYFTAVPSGSPLLAQINPLTGVNYVVGERVTRLIPQKFGNDYRPILKNNGTEVPPLASEDWFLDSVAGVVVSEDNLNLTNGTLECYIYVGKFLDEVLDDIDAGTGGSGGVTLQFAFEGGQDVDLDGYTDLTIHSESDHGVLIDTAGDSRFHSDGYVDLDGETGLRFSDPNNTQVLFSDSTEVDGSTLLTTNQSIIGAINEAINEVQDVNDRVDTIVIESVGQERAAFEITSDISSATGLELDGSQLEVSVLYGALELAAPEGYQFSFATSVFIYVNGQLLVNDSVSGTVPSRDVIWDGTDKLYFAFDLSPGDIVQVVNVTGDGN